MSWAIKGNFLHHDRAETFAQKPEHRENYDIVMARAVARMSVLSELCLPLVKPDGTFIAMKAASAQDEMDTGKKAIFTLAEKSKKFILSHCQRKIVKETSLL